MPKPFVLPLLILAIVLGGGCAGKKPGPARAPAGAVPATVGGKPGTYPRLSGRQRLLKIAGQEWDFFGRQTIRLDDSGESIPHVGKWEDDGDPWTGRVGLYWSAVGKSQLDGNDCKEPWSAAFISWIMRQAGLDSWQFPPADAHWHYVRHFVSRAGSPDAAFASHRVAEYSPQAGDLICATRGSHGFIPVYQDPGAVLGDHTKLHCDLVMERQGNTLAAIGGNVRNSVSKTWYPLDAQGHLKPTERRPWFVVLENRMGP